MKKCAIILNTCKVVKCEETQGQNESVSAKQVTSDRPLSLCEAAPEVVHQGHHEDELSLEARQLVPPVMPVRHVLGALVIHEGFTESM